MKLSKKRITKALIRLHGCEGWSAPVLFANPEDRFSRVFAQICALLIFKHISQSGGGRVFKLIWLKQRSAPSPTYKEPKGKNKRHAQVSTSGPQRVLYMSFTLNHSAKDDEFLGSTHILLSARNCIAYVQRGSLILLSVDWHQEARVECFEPVQKDVNSDRPTSAMQRSYSGICTLKIMAQ